MQFIIIKLNKQSWYPISLQVAKVNCLRIFQISVREDEQILRIAYSNTTEKLLACDFEKTSHETEVLLFITVFKSTQPVSMFLVSFLTCFF